MPSTYTTNGGIEKIASGEQSGTWGATTNDNFDIIDRLTNGVTTLTLTGASSNLTTSDGALSDGQNKVLILSGTPGVTHTITVLPADAQKLYFVMNNTSDSVIFDQGSGANATVEAGASDIIYCDGNGGSAAVVSLMDSLNLTTYLKASNNLSDLASSATALQNLGVTATASELNKLDGATVTTAQLDYNAVSVLGKTEASKTVTADSNGVVTFDNGVYEESVAVTSSSGNATLNMREGTNFTHTLTENTTYIFSNPAPSGYVSSFTLKITQDSTARTVTWPSGVKWAGNVEPDVSTDSGHIDIYVFITYDAGSNWYGFVAGQHMGAAV